MRFRLSRARAIGSSALATVLLVVAVLGANVLAGRADLTADLTAGNRLTLAAGTREVLDQVEEPLHIDVFVRAEGEAGRDAAALASRYRDANRRIRLEVVDPDAEPGKAQRLGVTRFGTAVLRYQGRRVDVTTVSEVELTSAILRLVRGRTPSACFVTGHDEPDLGDDGPQGLSRLAALASRNGFEPETRNVGVDGLDGCEVVVLAGPRVPLADGEVRVLQRHLRDDGKLLVLADALSDADVNPVLEDWGITFLGGVVLDRASNFNNDVSTPVITDFPSANQVVDGVPSLLAPASAGLHVPDEAPRGGLHVSVLARSSDDSVLAADPEDPSAGAIRGPVVVAAAADDSSVRGSPPVIHRTRVLVVADVAFASNAYLDALGNAKLLANGLSWLAQDELLLTVGTSDPDARPLVITPSRRRTAFAVTVVGVPLAVLVLGTVLLLVRRR
jgi:ABC-type uncharacterized transport system involved in gliding motility auxiliary subunit